MAITRLLPSSSINETDPAIPDCSNPLLDQRVDRAARSVWVDLAEGVKKSIVAKAVIATLLAATTIALFFLLVSNPVGWVASAIGVSILAAKALVGASIGLSLLAANFAAYKLQDKKTQQKVTFELSTLWRMMPGVTNYNEIPLEGLCLADGTAIPDSAKLYVGALPNKNRPESTIPPNVANVVSNNEEFEFSPIGLSSPLNEADWAERGAKFLRNETEDHLPVPPELMDKAADFLLPAIQNGKGALSNCRGGVGRSATSAAALMMKHLRHSNGAPLTIEEVCVRIKKGRKKAVIWNKLHALRKYDEYLKDHGVTRPERSAELNKAADQLQKMEEARKSGSSHKTPRTSKTVIKALQNPT
jgi:hypothetical protein